VLAPGGKTAYGLNAGASTTVIPVDLATSRVLRPHTFRRLILQFTVTPSGKSAWAFLGGTANTVELVRVNLATWAVSAPIKLPDGTQQVAFGPRDTTAYAFGTNQVTPVNLASRDLGTRISLPISPRAWPAGFALAPDGRTAMVYNFVRNRGVEIVPVNLARGTALSPVYLGYKLWVPQHVTFTPDSKTAYVSIVDDDLGELRLAKLIPVSAATGTRVGQPINLDGQPLQILVSR
jgi:DNA-binding beta-propeller fold protein YncE